MPHPSAMTIHNEKGTQPMMQVQVLFAALRTTFTLLRDRDEEGSVVETVILAAIFAAMALTVAGIIYSKVTAKANSIPMN